jgi:V-type H+-transporting ATPase subunit d
MDIVGRDYVLEWNSLFRKKQIVMALTFNVSSGYLDGIVRGYRSTLLTNSHYLNLTQCNTLDDLKLQLCATDYATALQNEPSPLSTSTINERCTDKLVEEFHYVQSMASGPLSRFLDYICYSYMIDNVILLITGTLHERDTQELIERCHPLGVFESMPALCVATNVVDLYHLVLVETPLAPYFKNCLNAHDLDEMNIEIIRNTLYKAYLEDFYRFVNEELDDVTAQIMSEILAFEADRRVINICINSFGTELTKDDRQKLFPALGKLYPEGHARLARADEVEHVRAACEVFLEYRGFFDQLTSSAVTAAALSHDTLGGGGHRTLEDCFFDREVFLNKLSFQQQFHYAIFYSLVKLREQEVRNIVWIAECIAQQQKDRMNGYIPIL